MTKKKKLRHLVALSFGKDSTALALRLCELYPDKKFEYIYTPTGNELPEMIDHIKNIQSILGEALTPVTNGASLQKLIRDQNCLPNHRMRWCTRIIKIEPFRQYVASAAPCVAYVGIRADEADRDAVDYSDIGGNITVEYPFIEWGWGIADVWDYLDSKNIKVPERTDCALCFYQRLGEWWRLWRDYPDHFKEGEDLELLVGHTLRSDGRDTWPAALKDLRKEFEKGRIPKGAAQQELDLGVYTRSRMCSICAR